MKQYRVTVEIENKQYKFIVKAQSEDDAKSEDILGLAIIKKLGYKPYLVTGVVKI